MWNCFELFSKVKLNIYLNIYPVLAVYFKFFLFYGFVLEMVTHIILIFPN